MMDETFFEQLRHDAQHLQHLPDDVTVARLTARVRARLGAQPTVALIKVPRAFCTMSSRSRTRVFSLSTVPSRSSTWPTKSHGPAAMNPVAITARGSPGQSTSPATCWRMNRPYGKSRLNAARGRLRAVALEWLGDRGDEPKGSAG